MIVLERLKGLYQNRIDIIRFDLWICKLARYCCAERLTCLRIPEGTHGFLCGEVGIRRWFAGYSGHRNLQRDRKVTHACVCNYGCISEDLGVHFRDAAGLPEQHKINLHRLVAVIDKRG